MFKIYFKIETSRLKANHRFRMGYAILMGKPEKWVSYIIGETSKTKLQVVTRSVYLICMSAAREGA